MPLAKIVLHIRTESDPGLSKINTYLDGILGAAVFRPTPRERYSPVRPRSAIEED